MKKSLITLFVFVIAGALAGVALAAPRGRWIQRAAPTQSQATLAQVPATPEQIAQTLLLNARQASMYAALFPDKEGPRWRYLGRFEAYTEAAEIVLRMSGEPVPASVQQGKEPTP